MLKFKVLQELNSNTELPELTKYYKYKIKKVKVLENTNIQFIEPTLYLITYPITLTILKYKVNEISNKPFYIKEYYQKYSLTEIKKIIKQTS